VKIALGCQRSFICQCHLSLNNSQGTMDKHQNDINLFSLVPVELTFIILKYVTSIYREVMRAVCVKWRQAILPNEQKTYMPHLLYRLAARNHISLIRWIHDERRAFQPTRKRTFGLLEKERLIAGAVVHGHSELILVYQKMGFFKHHPPDDTVVYWAWRSGHQKVLDALQLCGSRTWFDVNCDELGKRLLQKRYFCKLCREWVNWLPPKEYSRHICRKL
jgi:hypothetical protein